MTSQPVPGSDAAPRRPRVPGFLQLGATGVLAILLVTLALTTRQPPPPAIAEFAPQAVQQIKQAPKDQASQFGSGKGPGTCPPGAKCGAGTGPGNGTGPGGDGGSPPPPPKITPPGLPCIGDPPRQI